MGTQTFEIDGLTCLCCVAPKSETITYILYPMDILSDWIEAAAQKFGTTIVVITGMDWDDDLTPWPAKGVPKGCPDFKGLAPQFLRKLGVVVGSVESKLGLTATPLTRNLVGVSLSGLFTLWQWAQSSLFNSIASLSGSFWYDGFVDWFNRQDFRAKKGKAFFLLGSKESHTNIKAFQSVGVNTQTIVNALKSAGVNTLYETVPGDHYYQPIERLNRAMTALFSKS